MTLNPTTTIIPAPTTNPNNLRINQPDLKNPVTPLTNCPSQNTKEKNKQHLLIKKIAKGTIVSKDIAALCFSISYKKISWHLNNKKFRETTPFLPRFFIKEKITPTNQALLNPISNLSPPPIPILIDTHTSPSPLTNNHNNSLEEALKLYAEKKNFSNTKIAKKHITKQIKKKGSCYGTCTSLIYSLQQKNFQKFEDLFSSLHYRKKEIQYYQIIECLRGSFSSDFSEYKKNENILQSLHSLLPKQTSSKPLFFDATSQTKKRNLEEFTTSLQNSQNTAFLVIGEQEKRKTSHTILCCISESSQNYFFFNSQSSNLFSYPSKENLIKEFVHYTQLSMPYAF